MFALAVTDEGCSIKQTFMATPQDMQLSYSNHQMCMFILLTQASTIAETWIFSTVKQLTIMTVALWVCRVG